jgi:hypothetical protein
MSRGRSAQKSILLMKQLSQAISIATTVGAARTKPGTVCVRVDDVLRR